MAASNKFAAVVAGILIRYLGRAKALALLADITAQTQELTNQSVRDTLVRLRAAVQGEVDGEEK